MKLKLHTWIFIGMFVGLLAGLGLWQVDRQAAAAGTDLPGWYAYVMWWLELIGPTIFIALLKMIIAPLILASIVSGVTSLPNIGELGAIGWKTLTYYVATTTIAVVIGLIAVVMIQPGRSVAAVEERERRTSELQERETEYEQQSNKSARVGDELTDDYLIWLAQVEDESGGASGDVRYDRVVSARERTPGTIFVNDIVRPLLENPFKSLAETKALGIISFSLLLGIACTVAGPVARPVVTFFQALNQVILLITQWVMKVSPVAIGAIIAHLIAQDGPKIVGALAWYSGTVVLGIAAHIGVLVAIAYFVGGVTPGRLWTGLREAWMIAFSTRSSAATLPVTITCVTKQLGVSPKVANFSLPLGATMNMDGTALYEGVAVIFLIQVYGGLADVAHLGELSAITTLLIFITAVLASVGAAAVPSAGLVTMVLVATAVNLPVYYLPLIFAVDALLDMFRTSTNVLGDAVGAVVVNRLEGGRLGEGASDTSEGAG